MGLAALGHRTVRLVLLPHLADYLAHLQPLLDVQVTDCGLLCSPSPVDHMRVLDCAVCKHISCCKSGNDRMVSCPCCAGGHWLDTSKGAGSAAAGGGAAVLWCSPNGCSLRSVC